VRSYCTLPLTTAQKRFGALGLGSSRLNAYHDDDLHLLRGVAELVALALENAMTREGKVLILKIAEAGEVLGLSAEIAGEPFELTPETAGPCQVNFVERDAPMRLMEKNGEFGLHASQALSREFQSAYRDIQPLVLAVFPPESWQDFFFSWSPIREQFEALKSASERA
jgi:CRP-like cAMP-binding protein